MPSCPGFLEPRKSRLGPSKSTFNAESFVCSLSLSISIDFGTIRSWNVSYSPKLTKKSITTSILAFKVIDFGASREPVYDFLLVINSRRNLGPISHRFWDTATYWLKIANFFHPLSFNAFAGYDPCRLYARALRILKLEFSRQPMVKIWWS